MSALRGENSLYLFLSAYVSGLLLGKAGLFFLIAALLFWLLARLSRPARFWARNLALWSLAIAVGGLRMEVQNPCHDPKHYLNQPPSELWLVACRSQSEDRPKTQRIQAEVLAVLRHVPAADSLTGKGFRANVPLGSIGSVRENGRVEERKAKDGLVWQECRGLVQLYFPKADTSLKDLQYGDRLWLRGRLDPIEGFTGSDCWSYEFLNNTCLRLFEEAFDAISIYEQTDRAKYSVLYDRILKETLFVRKMLLDTYSSQIENVAQMRSEFDEDCAKFGISGFTEAG